MNADSLRQNAGPIGSADAGVLPALPSGPAPWQRWLSIGLSAALFIAIVLELFGGGADFALGAFPTAPGFYAGFLASYMALPLFDWLIFRRLWNLPASGVAPLVKKRALNEVLFGYSGELYFYLWARRHANLTRSPFGAVKDVSILSALAGNTMTLFLLLCSLTLAGGLALNVNADLLFGSGAIVVGISAAILLFRGRLFSLPTSDLRAVFGLHMARISISTLALALAWFAALPAVGAIWWIVLSALRLLINRLPLLPNRDLLFAAAAVFLIGGADEVGAVAAITAGLFLGANLLCGLTLALADMRRERALGA